MKILFNDDSKLDILNMFDMEVDTEDYIVNMKGEQVMSIENEPVKFNEFAGICKEGLIKGDLTSLINYTKKYPKDGN